MDTNALLNNEKSLQFKAEFLKEEYDANMELPLWNTRTQILIALAYPLAFDCNGYDLANYLNVLTGLGYDANDDEQVTLKDEPVMEFDDHIVNYNYVMKVLENYTTIALLRLFRNHFIFPSKPVDLTAHQLY